MKNRYSIIPIICLSALFVGSCKNAPQQAPTSFETTTITAQNLSVPITLSATISGKSDVNILPQVTGQITKVCVAEGNKVKKGQVLFTIDSREATLKYNAMKADLLAAEAQCNSAKLEYESNKNLYEKKIISSYLLNTSQNNYEQAKAAVEQAKAALEFARLQLDFHTIYSPQDGIVGNVPVYVGDLVTPSRMLTTVSSNAEVKANFSIPELSIQNILNEYKSIDSLISILPEVTLFLKDGTEYPFKGRIVTITGIVDKATGSVKGNATFPNPDGMLFSGMQGNISMMTDYNDVKIIPLTAVTRVQDQTFVFKVKDNCAESTIVSLEEIGNGKEAAVISGLEVGDVIITKGVNKIYDGMQVIFPENTDKSK